MNKLRLLLWDTCNRSCEGCCNKQFDTKALPVETDFTKYSLIMLTGGEPMLYPEKVKSYLGKIRACNPECYIVLYTAHVQNLEDTVSILQLVDGLTLTLHEPRDVFYFEKLNSRLTTMNEQLKDKSLRLNVFREVDVSGKIFPLWKVKSDMVWIKDCPLPSGEVLMRASKAL